MRFLSCAASLTSLALFSGLCFVTDVSAAGKAVEAKTEKSTPKTKPVDPLLKKIEEAIDISERRYLSSEIHSPWQIFHGLLALRQDYLIKLDGKKTSALDWMSTGVSFRGEPWFQKTKFGGRPHPYSEPYAFEGHPNQSLAILAMADVAHDHKFKTPAGTITTMDMVKNAQMEMNGQDEVTWTLWALIHYLGPDAVWQNKYGQQWSIEELMRTQINDPAGQAACGGTHGLFSLTFARNTYLKTGKPLRGIWLEADQKIRNYSESARYLQNSDGSFSTEYFNGNGFSNDFQKRLETSGHTLEFVMLALPDETLKKQWVRNAVNAAATDLIEHRRETVECAPLYHALNGLVIYRDRIAPKPVADKLAGKSSSRIDVEVRKPVQPPLKQDKKEKKLGKKKQSAAE